MAKLQNYNGRYCESEYENAFISFLEEEGWQYLAGNSGARATRRLRSSRITLCSQSSSC